MGSSKGSHSCDVCGSNMLLYKCKYCGKVFCEKHRRPQDHQCSGLANYQQQLEAGIAGKPGVAVSPSADAHAGKSSGLSSVVRWSLRAARLFAIAFFVIVCIVVLVMLIGYIDSRMSSANEVLPVKNMTGVQVTLVNNRNATDPTYDELVLFLKSDNTSSLEYVSPGWTCADFARRLHDNAEAQGIRAAFVGVEFYEGSVDYSIYDDGSGNFSPPVLPENIGHGLNMFNTTDKGPVYVDASSIYGEPGEDRIAYAVEGLEFNEIDLDYVKSIDYAYYSAYRQKYLEYIYELKECNLLAKEYNESVAEPGMDMSQMAVLLEARSDAVAKKKAETGPFYYPFGTVKKIDVYW